MNMVVGLVIGLLAGWLIEWVIDWVFWRKSNKNSQQQLAASQDAHELREKLTQAEATIRELQAKLASMSARQPDRLEKIHGIGSVFARRFNEAGVTTFADLANLNPNDVRQIIAAEEWQKIDPESWVNEAKKLADAANGS